jgi:hypothetical protein
MEQVAFSTRLNDARRAATIIRCRNGENRLRVVQPGRGSLGHSNPGGVLPKGGGNPGHRPVDFDAGWHGRRENPNLWALAFVEFPHV